MKKLLLLLVLVVIAMPAQAGFRPTEENTVVTLDKVFKMPDDSYVTIIGNIVKQVGKEKYLVKSGNSTSVVEIDDALLWNIDVTPKKQVKITGEVERDFRSVELDASKIEIIK